MRSYFTLLLIFSVSFDLTELQATSPQDMAKEIIQGSLKETQESQEAAKKFLESLDGTSNTEPSFFGMDQDLSPSIQTHSSSKIEKSCSTGRVFQHKNPLSTLLVFVTLSMGDEALKAYSYDVQKTGGRLVIRGLVDDSFVKTQKRLQELGIEVDIDPTVFEDFKVENVPTFIHVKGMPGHYKSTHDRLSGNVSISHALEEFKQSGDLKVDSMLKALGERT
ncbi:type-F conjugative transfer system pilin assembly protein TrbC [Candidatus Nucleicultrix amoebiphila]|uniref:type-F conjugative transfer system pilin assembly protein TrbC n=1 Tax=Candidatus Nucleicultrix amoebiphila TaxID=1509244 RepID=UPI000A2688B8|nr:type-F conjugative transfer system pilin assembly protein TrbC [Candidatus Nucleicultrix amoebiphila]